MTPHATRTGAGISKYLLTSDRIRSRHRDAPPPVMVTTMYSWAAAAARYFRGRRRGRPHPFGRRGAGWRPADTRLHGFAGGHSVQRGGCALGEMGRGAWSGG